MELLNWIKDHKIFLVVIIIFIVLMPVIIVHLLFSFTINFTFLNPKWTAGEVLGYFGNILGAMATIIAIIITMKFTIENQKNERKLSIKPNLQTNFKRISYNDIKNKIEQAEKNILFIKYPSNKNERIESSYNYSSFFDNSVKKSLEGKIIGNLQNSRDYCIILYSISNVGAGNAIKLKFKINNLSVFIKPFSIAKNDKLLFIIILKKELLENNNSYYSLLFQLNYQDVASLAEYEQHETIDFKKDDKNNLDLSQKTNQIISSPSEVEK